MKKANVYSFMALVFTYCLIYGAYAEPVQQSRELDSFKKVVLEVPAHVYIKAGQPQSFTISAKQETLDKIATRVSGEKLIIDNTETIRKGGKVVINISVPNLNEVKISGSGAFEIRDLNESKFTARISGSGKFDVAGQVQALDVLISGSGKGEFTNLEAEKVFARISGSGNVKVFAQKELEAKISGSGNIKYKGTPQVESSISGSGKVASL